MPQLYENTRYNFERNARKTITIYTAGGSPVTQTYNLHEPITIDTLSSDIPDWDSLGHLTIFMELESAFPEDYNSDPRFASVVSVKEIIDIMRGN